MHMFEGIRPFDWLMLVIETLVLLLIFYEIIAETIRRTREHRRQSSINERVVELSRFVDRGLRLQSVVPDEAITTDQRIMAKWLAGLEMWTEEANAYLLLHSPRASAAFLLTSNAGDVNYFVVSLGRQFALNGRMRESYQRLVVQLENLKRIIERPEAYF